MTVLVIAAHPDDEVLGCGGTIARHAADGTEVNVLFVCDGVGARGNESEFETALAERRAAARAAGAVLGINSATFLDFPDNKLDSVPLLDVVQAIEPVVTRYMPSTIYTHHVSDLNIDHELVARAVVTACRPLPDAGVTKLLSFEVLSSTEWQQPFAEPAFSPNHFVGIDRHLEQKIRALQCYSGEMREFPHSRSEQAVRALATYRGVSSGLASAEAFLSLRTIER